MASGDHFGVLLQAAQDTNIPDAGDEMCWPALEKYLLRCSKLDPTARTPEEWVKLFEECRDLEEQRLPSSDSGYDSSLVCSLLLF